MFRRTTSSRSTVRSDCCLVCMNNSLLIEINQMLLWAKLTKNMCSLEYSCLVDRWCFCIFTPKWGCHWTALDIWRNASTAFEAMDMITLAVTIYLSMLVSGRYVKACMSRCDAWVYCSAISRHTLRTPRSLSWPHTVIPSVGHPVQTREIAVFLAVVEVRLELSQAAAQFAVVLLKHNQWLDVHFDQRKERLRDDHVHVKEVIFSR